MPFIRRRQPSRPNRNIKRVCCLLTVFMLLLLFMVLFSIFGKRGMFANGIASPSSSSSASTPSISMHASKAEVEDRLRGALWGVRVLAACFVLFFCYIFLSCRFADAHCVLKLYNIKNSILPAMPWRHRRIGSMAENGKL